MSSSSATHRLPPGDNKAIRVPTGRPTGLRTRDSPMRAHQSPSSLPAPRSASARLEASDFRSRATDHTPPLIKSSPSARTTRKRTWISSASKRLPFTKPRKQSRLSPAAAATDMGTPDLSKNPSLRAPALYPHSLSGSSRSPVPAALNPTYHPSPTEKPLPSLPVATVKSKSPVRRSLIDCTERPLRRSLTPPDGGNPQEEDWPSIEPTKPGGTSASRDGQYAVKPSLGESFIEGMRGLNLDEKRQEALKVHFEEPVGRLSDAAGMKPKPDPGQASSVTFATAAASRPLSSSQLPKPRESMLESLSRHVDKPVIRHTKASALKARYSIGNKAPGSSGKKSAPDGQQIPVRDEAESLSSLKPQYKAGAGPIRTYSRGRFGGVTNGGSPYSYPPRSGQDVKENGHHQTDASGEALADRSDIAELPEAHDGPARQSASPTRLSLRQSSIPLPSRVIRPSVDAHAHEIASELPNAESLVNLYVKKHPKVHQRPTSFAQPNDDSNGNAADADSASDPNPEAQLMNVHETLATPLPREDVSISGSDDTGGSVHGYDDFGGFRVKRVRNASRMGPTLRIMDSASRILLGNEDESNNLGTRDSKVILKQKSSAPDLRTLRSANDQVRRSSALLTRSWSYARGLTDRSASQYKRGDDLETQNLIGNNNSTETVHRAELSGSTVGLEKLSYSESQPDTNVMESTSQTSSDQRSTAHSNHGDWPCKDFATFNLCSDAVAPTSTEESSTAQASVDPVKRAPSRASNRSRPPTIVLRAVPDRETAPFLFQDLEREQAKHQKFLMDVTSKLNTDRETPTEAKPTTTFPPRTSSRKPRPPPILVSAPENLPSLNFLVGEPRKVQAVHPDSIKKPKNVKTFSQSISPNTDSNKARKISNILSHSPSSSSKKVFSNLRGRLFQKRSTESAMEANGSDTESMVASRLRLENSVRRKPVPRSETNRIVNPLLNPSKTQGYDINSRLPTHAEGPYTVTGKHRNPLTSPTTPFTAGFGATPSATSMPTSAKPTSPGRSQSPPTPSLSTATHLTHTLLDLARVESHPQRKANLIELSKCMVEVVSAARDAEKSMEKAKMEAARAEVCWLKVQKEVTSLEGVVKGLVEGMTAKEK